MPEPDHQPVVVRERLTKPHPLVAATQQAAVGARPDETGRLVLGRGGVAKVKISRSALPRALRLLDALCKGAEARGWEVEAETRYNGNPNMSITSAGHQVEFTMQEETTRHPHTRTRAEEEIVRRGRGYGIPQWDYQVTGRLLLRLDDYSARRSNFRDGVRQRLDERLGDVLDEVAWIFGMEEQRRVERREREEAEARRRVVAVEAAYQRLIQERRREAVEEQVTRWRFARDLRVYSESVREGLPDMGEVAGQDAQQWLAWVDEHLREELEPLIAAPSMPPDPERRDTSIAPLVAGHLGNRAWLDWLAAAE